MFKLLSFIFKEIFKAFLVLVEYPFKIYSLKTCLSLSDSGFFSDAKSVAQCGVKVLAGYEMGFKAFQSMTGIHIIQGKPSVGAGLMAARIRSSGKYDYEVLEQSDVLCKIAVYEIELKADIVGLKRQFAKGQIDQDRYKQAVEMLALGISSFGIEEARKAGTKNLWNRHLESLFQVQLRTSPGPP